MVIHSFVLALSILGHQHSSLTTDERTQALKDIKAKVSSGYVIKAKREAVIARLDSSAKQGLYNTSDPVQFAQRITRDFQAVTQDKHLYLDYNPAWYKAALAPKDPNTASVDNAAEVEISHMTNHGITEMKVLTGNIRYLKIEGFGWIEDETPLVYDGAMRFLKGGDAIIIDLRGNTGGWTQAAKYLISHFLDGDTLYGTFVFADGHTEQQRTLDHVPVGRIKGKPLYVLVDNGTRSAGEQVAYNVRQFKLGELVGETTAGASYSTDEVPIAPGFRLSYSISEEIHPIDKVGWEVIGVKPTIAVSPATALDVAQLHAMDKLLPTAKGISKNQLAWAKPAIQAALSPVTLSEQELAAYVGTYGVVSVVLKGKSLWLNRPDRDPAELKAMTRDGLFQAVGIDSLRVQFSRNQLEILRPDPEMNRTFKK